VTAESVAVELLMDMAAGHGRDIWARFERLAARLTGLPQVRLCSQLARPAIQPGVSVYSVPVRGWSGRYVLEALTTDPSSFDNGTVKECLKTLAEVAPLVLRAQASPRRARDRNQGQSSLVGSSGPMQALRRKIEEVATGRAAVLIEGETGVGKDLVAREIHHASDRRMGPFVAVNCAAMVETLIETELFGIADRVATGVRGRLGYFEQAHGGTLFLDEVADLSLPGQAKLLRVLQDLRVQPVGSMQARQLDVRVVAATNRPLGVLVAERRFRSDLWFRLKAFVIRVPPLREHVEDVQELVENFIKLYGNGDRWTLSAQALDLLISHMWPGNVRELEHAIESAIAARRGGGEIAMEHLPDEIRVGYEPVTGNRALGGTLRERCSRYVRATLRQCGNNKSKACEQLDISYHTLQRHLEYGLDAVDPPMGDPPTGSLPVSRNDAADDRAVREAAPDGAGKREQTSGPPDAPLGGGSDGGGGEEEEKERQE